MNMHGADADQLDALAAEFLRTADDIDRDSSLLTRTISNVSWIGDVASSFLSGWTGQNVPRIGLSTHFLRNAASNLQRNAAQQRAASSAGGASTSSAATGAPPASPPPKLTPGQALEAQLKDNEERVRQYLESLDPNDPLRRVMEARLAEGYRVLHFDPMRSYLAWASPNFGTATNVVVAVPGTGGSMHSITNDAARLHAAYGEDTAVVAALVWETPHNIPDNINLNTRERTLQSGPLGQMLTDLHATGRSIVVSGHSAGGAAVQTFFSQNPEYFAKVDGVALLAPAEYHAEFAIAAATHGVPAVFAVHSDDPIQLVHGDDYVGKVVAENTPGVDIVSKASYDRSLPSYLAALPDMTVPVNIIGAHDQDGYVISFHDDITGMFPGTEQLPDGMVRQRYVDSDGTVITVDVGTF